MRTPSPPYCRLDLVPPLADRFILGVAPIDYGPELLRKPFGFHLTVDTLPSAVQPNGGCRSALICCRLSPLCPFRFLHTFRLLCGHRGITPACWIRRPSSGRRRDSNPPELLAAQRTPYGPLRLPPPPGSGPRGPPVAPAFAGARGWTSRVDACILGTHVDVTTPAA